MNLYVGEDDGKLHFVNAGGADSVIPFNKGISVPLWHYQMNGSYSTIEFDVSDYSTLSIGGNDASGTCALQVICDGAAYRVIRFFLLFCAFLHFHAIPL